MAHVQKLIPVLIGIVLVGAGLFGLLTLFSSRDTGDLSDGRDAASGPGVAETAPGDPPTSGTKGGNPRREGAVPDAVLVRALAAGDVALVYGTAKPPPDLRRLRDDATGPFDPELAAAGQMALLVRREGVDGVQALAWKRRLEVGAPTDPRLREFVEAWLGKGEGSGG